MALKVGALFAGMGGLEIGLEQVLDAEVAWLSEIEKGPSAILAHRYPGVPNHGDITKIDWAQVEPVDIITGGSPCTDISNAGKRAGMKPGTRSGLWQSMADAIETIRPQLVIWENVYGALSAPALTGELEQCEFCMGDPEQQPMRALGRVLGDLADLGFDAEWVSLRAADIGAPHNRGRVFVAAWPTTPNPSDNRRWQQLPRRPRPQLPRAPSLSAPADTFGTYAPALTRWAQIIGRPPPPPLDERGRTSPRFNEFLMGLPDGWVTDVPIKRNDQFIALGNGVVPLQSAEAIRYLLQARAQHAS